MVAVFLLAILAPSAGACSSQADDAIRDTNPTGLPGYFDLLAVNATRGETGLLWSWDLSSLEGARSVQYSGQFTNGTAPPNESPDGSYVWHVACAVFTVGVGADMECRLTRVRVLAGNVATGEYIGALNATVDSNRISVVIPWDFLDFDANATLGNAGAMTQLVASVQTPVGGTNGNPQVTDEIERVVFACEAGPASGFEGAPAPSESPPKAKDAPWSGWAAILALAFAAVRKRR